MMDKAHENDKKASEELKKLLNKYDDKSLQKGAIWENVKVFSKPNSLLALGFLGALCCGFIMPSYGFILPKLIFAMILPADMIMEEVDFWAGMMFLAAIGYGAFYFVQKYAFGVVGANIAKGCRESLYSSLLGKHLGWHDHGEHSAGIMTVILAKDTAAVEGVATETIAIMLQTILAMIFSIVLGFFYSW